MYVEDLRKDFYEHLGGKRVFLMVHYDIDSICACKILQAMFQHRHVIYSLAVIRGLGDLKTAYDENSDDCKYFILVNCGGTLDLVDLLEPEEDVVFFILDAHRPTDLCNIYSNGQVRLLWEAENDQQVPEFHDVFREDSDEESGEDNSESDNEENQASKRRRLGEDAIMKRRERRLWEDNRNKLMFEYAQFTYYSTASAVLIYQLAWRLNLDDKDLLWLAIVAITEQLLLGKIERTQYVLATGTLQAHAQRLQNKTADSDVATSLRIVFQKDMHLALYRHWTVEASLKYSQFTACRMRLWTLRGDKKLQELLVEMGLPLAQSKQSFRAMDLELRREFQGSLEKLADKYGLSDIVFATFLLQFGYRNKYSASDVVYALLSILESAPRGKEPEECFNTALDCLNRSRTEILNAGIEKAKLITKTIFKTVQSALDMKSVVLAGPFIYYIVQEGCAEWYMFSQQHILTLLAKFILEAFVATSRNKRASSLPLIVSAPSDVDTGMCIILGIPPFCEKSPKNFFGKAFEQAAKRISSTEDCDFFDTAWSPRRKLLNVTNASLTRHERIIADPDTVESTTLSVSDDALMTRENLSMWGPFDVGTFRCRDLFSFPY